MDETILIEVINRLKMKYTSPVRLSVDVNFTDVYKLKKQIYRLEWNGRDSDELWGESREIVGIYEYSHSTCTLPGLNNLTIVRGSLKGAEIIGTKGRLGFASERTEESKGKITASFQVETDFDGVDPVEGCYLVPEWGTRGGDDGDENAAKMWRARRDYHCK